MQQNLKLEIEELTRILKDSKKHALARQIEKNWQKTCLNYSEDLNNYSPGAVMEQELIKAFEEELKRLKYPSELRKSIIISLEKRRILQTAPHLVPIFGPRMLCADWLASLGVPKKEFHVAGMFSGISFSNNHHPGRIETKKEEINLVPSVMQDSLVYKSRLPEKTVQIVKTLPVNLKKVLPQARTGSSYAKWATQSCQKIQSKILNKKNLAYLDINEVVAGYLMKVLKNDSHIINKIFFDDETRKKFNETFPNETMFCAPASKGKYGKTEKFILSNGKLKSGSREILLENPSFLASEMREKNLCPSLFLVFATLVFLNRFKCFGSFAQVEYLSEYQKKLANLDFMEKFKISSIPTENLTLGAFDDEQNLYPADLIAEDKMLVEDKNMLFGKIILNMKERLLNNYAK